ncbi:Qat anti-phage system TatD family nuclease QatD [Ralstonia sp. R-29]|uniref:Qat anti-phage system TatD family nuclease QatD n=1 Tax=Ralstonia sp. R-29 TaxID=3404059 RepID=UPI003CF13302
MDLHSHLDLYPDALRLLPEVNKRNRFTLVVTTSPRAWVATSRVFAGYENIQVALGLHPEIVERKSAERDLLLSYVSQTRFVGEVGLDGSPKFRASLPAQEDIFRAVIAECERQGGRIISLHSRGATTKVLDVLDGHPLAGSPILHWFSGSVRELQRAIELGCWFSVGPAMLAGAKGRELLSRMPAERVLPETDGPFAAANNVSLMPWDALDIAPVLSETWGMQVGSVVQKLEQNLERLLSTIAD